MTLHSTLALAVGMLVVVRLTRLVTTDTVTARYRVALAQRLPRRQRPHPVLALVNCDWCMSVWTSAGVAALLLAMGLVDWRVALIGWPAMAGGAGLLLDAVRS